MSDPSNAQFYITNDMAPAPVILLNGLPVMTTYMANCRLCLGSNFGERSTNIVEEQFSFMLKQVFSFPIPNQIGLPMNVCSKCRRGVELFFKYTNKVIMNQKKLQKTFIQVDYQQTVNTGTAVHERAQQPDTNRGAGISSVVEIVSDDETEKDDMLIEVDMQCEHVTDDGENGYDPVVQPPTYEETDINFVEVPDMEDFILNTDTNNFECIATRGKRPVAEEPLAIEIISLSDEENEGSAEAGGRPNDRKQKKSAAQKQHPLPKPQSSARTSSQAKLVAATINNVNNKPIINLAGGVTMVYYAADANEETISPANGSGTTNASSSKRNVRSTINEPKVKRRTQEPKNARHSASRSRTSEKGK